MEKIFPPSFFDVMEHLTVHLPYEADLGGPVQFRWMYPFERFMGHLKGKAKNLAKVEGSIVQGSLTEETSNFASYYFSPNVRTRRTATKRYDDGGVAPVYRHVVPSIFKEIGRLTGKLKEKSWDHEDLSAAHNYILRNLDEVHQFERHDVKPVPILVGAVSAENEAMYGELLAKYVDDPKNFFSVSSDFCHWGFVLIHR